MFDLYNHLKQLALSNGYTSIKQFCIAANVSPSTLTEIRKGRATNISATTAEKFANTLGVSVDTIYGRTNIINEHDFKSAFWDDAEFTPEEIDEMWQETKEYIEFKKAQKRKKK